MPRGRRKRIAQSHPPPRGYFKHKIAALVALRDGRISSTYHSLVVLYDLIDMFSWNRDVCDLTDRQLAEWMGGVSESTIQRLLGKLRDLCLVRVFYEGGKPGVGRRFLQPLDGDPSVELDGSGDEDTCSPPAADFLGNDCCPSVEPDSLGTDHSPLAADLNYSPTHRTPIGAPTDGASPKEEVYSWRITVFPHNLPPPRLILHGGGVEGAIFPPTHTTPTGEGVIDGGSNGETAPDLPSHEYSPYWQGVKWQEVEELVRLMTAEGVFQNLARILTAELVSLVGYDRARAHVWGHILDLRSEGMRGSRMSRLLSWRVCNVLPTDWALEQAVCRISEGEEVPSLPQVAPESPPPVDPPPGGDTLVTAGHTACQVWERALETLQLTFTRSAFNLWLRDTRLAAYEDGTFVIAVASESAREWLTHRLKQPVLRALKDVMGQPAAVRFVVESHVSSNEEVIP